jgi:hypothetical protein
LTIAFAGLIGLAPAHADQGAVFVVVPTPKLGAPPLEGFDYECSFPQTGTYQLSLAFEGAANGWAVSRHPAQISLQEVTTVGAPGGSIPHSVYLFGDDASGDATVRVTVMSPAPATPHEPTQEELDQADAAGVMRVPIHPVR